jgi:hypothetical protein
VGSTYSSFDKYLLTLFILLCLSAVAPTPPCTPIYIGSSSTVYTAMSGSATSYTCHAFGWQPTTTGPVTLAFQFRHISNSWYLDDVSVYEGGVQMIGNGGFETGSLFPWIRTTPNGICTGSPAQVTTVLLPHSGTYHLRDGSQGCADQIGQQFMANAGQLYIVSFWLKSGALASGILANVTLS